VPKRNLARYLPGSTSLHSRASRRASATAFPNRFDRDGPNSTVNTRSIQATLTEAAADRRATRKSA
jgi:hypothetical protein